MDEIETEAPPARRNVVLLVLALLMVGLLVGTQLVSHRPRFLTSRPWVVHVADIPEGSDEKLVSFIGDQSYVIPRQNYLPPFGSKEAPGDQPDSRPMLGYSIREVDALGMPFLAYKDAGDVLYIERAGDFQMVPLDEDGSALFDKQVGQSVGHDYTFPAWRYMWGWTLIVLLAAWVLVRWRAKVRRREELGII